MVWNLVGVGVDSEVPSYKFPKLILVILFQYFDWYESFTKTKYKFSTFFLMCT